MTIKRKTITCHCNAYSFPHHWKGGKCFAYLPHHFAVTREEELQQQIWEERERERIILRISQEFEYDH